MITSQSKENKTRIESNVCVRSCTKRYDRVRHYTSRKKRICTPKRVCVVIFKWPWVWAPLPPYLRAARARCRCWANRLQRRSSSHTDREHRPVDCRGSAGQDACADSRPQNPRCPAGDYGTVSCTCKCLYGCRTSDVCAVCSMRRTQLPPCRHT